MEENKMKELQEQLKENLEEYSKLTKQVEELKSKLEQLKGCIVESMDSLGVTSYKADDVEGKLVSKNLYKYKDEMAIVNYLKKNKLDNYLQEKINTTVMNKELKNKGLLYESLKDYVEENNSIALSVKEIK